MKNTAFGLILFICCVSCKSTPYVSDSGFKSVTTDTILSDKISIRAILIQNDRIYYTGSKGKVGYIPIDAGPKSIGKVEVQNTPLRECRSLASNGENIFALSIGDSARLRKYEPNLILRTTVYKEYGEKVFYDSMNFWNHNEGIAIGDPTADCLSVIITRDGGETWNKISCNNLPKVAEGEAAFAASNTNICIKGDNAWVVSGGKKSRVFYSPDKGNSWQVFETPIVQGEAMTGIFTADFYDERIGVIAGGNYEKPEQNFQNKAMTYDGGKTWKLVGENAGFGYASCIQFVPQSKGKGLVCVGTSGLYYSADGGTNWKQLLADKDICTIRFLNANTAFAAGKNKIIRINFKK